MALVSSNTLHEVLHGRVPYYLPEMSSGFRLEPDEHPVVRRKATFAEFPIRFITACSAVDKPVRFFEEK